MRKISALLTTLALAGLLAATGVPAQAHMGIALRTYGSGGATGDLVADHLDTTDTLPANGNAQGLVAGPPVSPKQTCNGCHSYDSITSAYHFQLGLDERVDMDNDGFKDDLGQLLVAGEDGKGGLLAGLPTLYNISSPGQFGAW
jgi:hypothetical protein